MLECCLQAARERKQTKPNYTTLINDLEAMGFSANLDTLEVSSLGHFKKKAIATLHAILPNFNKKQDLPSPTRTKQDRSGLLLPHLSCKKCNLELEHPSYPFVPNVNYNLVNMDLCLALCDVMSL